MKTATPEFSDVAIFLLRNNSRILHHNRIQHLLIDSPVAQKILVLRQVAQRLPASKHHLTGIRCQLADNDL